ncbi:uncharacterized protein LOC117642462 [Thrips palmi]|uniref:Uncharacterized protein LOC117642462 n=1 Tax=Thrips palmi TaxID=161013 RepID=A0A6P8YHX9_THRPL|nr:uncharacterized protein LOC117642462 [Thrips palmi]
MGKLWSILGKLVGSNNPPFITAIYCGSEDLTDVDLYLGDFVLEVHDLQQNGYECNGQVHNVGLRHFILDAPARSFVKCCIGHGGYGACEKCTVVGVYEDGRFNYSHLGADCRPRTDESYANQEDRPHHTGISPLQLLRIGLVSLFRLDTLHLVYKRVLLRYLEALVSWEGYWNPNADTVNAISTRMLALIPSCPWGFKVVRQVR